MHSPLTTSSGPERVRDWLGAYKTDAVSLADADGLTLVGPGLESFAGVALPARLRQFLLDLRLLRNVPIAYLVPDARLLPPESIRFFEVDLTWIDRVVDGVLTAANIGTVEFTYGASLMALIRNALDDDLVNIAKLDVPDTTWSPSVIPDHDADTISDLAAKPMTGMLMRSQAVRRWPDMKVVGYDKSKKPTEQEIPGEVAVLRSEPLSRDIYIVLFAGRPSRVEIREPHAGTRFGVEEAAGGTMTLDGRNSTGEPGTFHDPITGEPAEITVTFRHKPSRTLAVAGLADLLGGAKSAHLALQLEQRAFVQEFMRSVPEELGSTALPADEDLPTCRRNRPMSVGHLRGRLDDADALQAP